MHQLVSYQSVHLAGIMVPASLLVDGQTRQVGKGLDEASIRGKREAEERVTQFSTFLSLQTFLHAL